MSRALQVGLTVVLILTLAAGGWWWFSGSGDELSDRREQVADKGAAVMPFDLTRTTHVFTKNDVGGIEVVTANDPADVEQVRLIRDHLRDERERFARGDFDDPAAIHGHDMPGLAVLRAHGGEVRIEYQSRTDGAQLVLSADDQQLVGALHEWFNAQTSDHG
jgi:hypothetical protein